MEIIKKNYDEIKEEIESLDVILFAGTDFVSKSIRYLQKKHLGCGEFSHLGLIIKADILDNYNLDKDKIYVWESTSSYKEKNKDIIKNKAKLGVQLRDFDDLINNYRGKIVLGRLKNNPWKNPENKNFIKTTIESLFVKYQGRNYDYNIINLFSALYPKIRPLRYIYYKIFSMLKKKTHKNKIFCSELVAIVYRELNIFDKNIDVKNFIPVDILGLDEDGTICPLQYPLIYISHDDTAIDISQLTCDIDI